MMDLTTSSERLKAWRKSMGLSQRALGEALQVSQGYIGDIEAGRTEPSRNFLVVLQEVYGVRSDYILYGQGQTTAAIALAEAGAPLSRRARIDADIAAIKAANSASFALLHKWEDA